MLVYWTPSCWVASLRSLPILIRVCVWRNLFARWSTETHTGEIGEEDLSLFNSSLFGWSEFAGFTGLLEEACSRGTMLKLWRKLHRLKPIQMKSLLAPLTEQEIKEALYSGWKGPWTWWVTLFKTFPCLNESLPSLWSTIPLFLVLSFFLVGSSERVPLLWIPYALNVGVADFYRVNADVISLNYHCNNSPGFLPVQGLKSESLQT